MSFLKSWRRKTHRWFLQRVLAKQDILRESTDLKTAQSIGVLFDATELKEQQPVLDWVAALKQQGKQVHLLAYFRQKEKAQNLSFPHFSKKETDWALRPKDTAVEDFIAHRFDILLNLSLSPQLPLDYICAISKAAFRVGPSTADTDCYDMQVDIMGQQRLDIFIKQVTYFLNKMTPKHGKAEA